MDCRTAQSLINSYIEKKMTIEQLEQFLKHVKNCPSCYDELETYFIVYYAMKRLDDKEGSFNMSKLLQEDMKKRRRQVLCYRIQEIILIILILITASIVVMELLQMLGIILF